MRRSSWLILIAAGLLHIGLLIGWRFQAPLVPYFFDATVLSGGRGLDFYSVYQAGYNARHGWDIYEGDPAHIRVVVPYFTPYRYLPSVAYTVGAALSLLQPLTAYKLWVVVVELTLLSCAGASFYFTRADQNLAARLAAMWLVFTPYYLELFMGQFSLIQAALIFGMLLVAGESYGTDQTLSENKKELTDATTDLTPRPPSLNRQGVPLGQGDATGITGLYLMVRSAQTFRVSSLFDHLWIASVLWKINTIVFVPALARLRRWRTLVLGGLLTAALTLPYFAVFPAHFGDFVTNNFGNTVAGHELGNLGFRQLVFEILAVLGASPTLQRVVQVGVVAAAVIAALALTFRRKPPPLAPILSLWLVAFFLISPQVWEHHYVMLLPALVVAYRHRPSRWVAGLWLLFALPTPFGFTALQPAIAANHDLRAFLLQPAWQLLWQHASKAVPSAILFGYLGFKIVANQPEPVV